MDDIFKKPDIYLCSFYDTNLTPSAKRLNMQAKIFGVFKNIFLYNENMLTGDFKEHFKDKLVPSRGFGYWVWKPYIILETMKKLNYGDILLYLDIGCHLSKTEKSIKRFNDYIDIVKENNALSFQLSLIESNWTKQDLFNYFKVLSDKNITDTCQIQATVIFMKKTDPNISILEQWLKVYYDDFSLTDDSPSKIPNGPSFNEHRHDQSIWSILSKINNLQTLSVEEMSHQDNFPIQVWRDKIYMDSDYLGIILKNNYENYSTYMEKVINIINKIVWYIPIKYLRDKFKSKYTLKIMTIFNSDFKKYIEKYEYIIKENRKYLVCGKLEIHDEELCPCYSGKKYKDCHGKK